jgi:hypothetical protein
LRRQLSDGQKLLSDGQKLLSDGQKLLSDGQKLLSDGRKLPRPLPGHVHDVGFDASMPELVDDAAEFGRPGVVEATHAAEVDLHAGEAGLIGEFLAYYPLDGGNGGKPHHTPGDNGEDGVRTPDLAIVSSVSAGHEH